MTICAGCDGSGIRAPAEPLCALPLGGPDWIVVERCDHCERYTDDLAAAQHVSTDASWVQCSAGGWHAMARA